MLKMRDHIPAARGAPKLWVNPAPINKCDVSAIQTPRFPPSRLLQANARTTCGLGPARLRERPAWIRIRKTSEASPCRFRIDLPSESTRPHVARSSSSPGHALSLRGHGPIASAVSPHAVSRLVPLNRLVKRMNRIIGTKNPRGCQQPRRTFEGRTDEQGSQRRSKEGGDIRAQVLLAVFLDPPVGRIRYTLDRCDPVSQP